MFCKSSNIILQILSLFVKYRESYEFRSFQNFCPRCVGLSNSLYRLYRPIKFCVPIVPAYQILCQDCAGLSNCVSRLCRPPILCPDCAVLLNSLNLLCRPIKFSVPIVPYYPLLFPVCAYLSAYFSIKQYC